MILERWHTWQPLKKMTGEYYIKSCINDEFCKLTVILQQQKNTKLHISFDSIEAYRVTNETYKLKLWEYLSSTHPDLNRRWPLFRIENSNFLKFLSEESETISDDRHFKHYCIIDSGWSIDIASPIEPTVELFVDSTLAETNAT